MALTEQRVTELMGQITTGMGELFSELEERKKELWRHVSDGDEDIDRTAYEELVQFQVRIDRGVTYVGRIAGALDTATFVDGKSKQLKLPKGEA